jgi:hypothetical protein
MAATPPSLPPPTTTTNTRSNKNNSSSCSSSSNNNNNRTAAITTTTTRTTTTTTRQPSPHHRHRRRHHHHYHRHHHHHHHRHRAVTGVFVLLTCPVAHRTCHRRRPRCPFAAAPALHSPAGGGSSRCSSQARSFVGQHQAGACVAMLLRLQSARSCARWRWCQRQSWREWRCWRQGEETPKAEQAMMMSMMCRCLLARCARASTPFDSACVRPKASSDCQARCVLLAVAISIARTRVHRRYLSTRVRTFLCFFLALHPRVEHLGTPRARSSSSWTRRQRAPRLTRQGCRKHRRHDPRQGGGGMP